MWTTLFEIMRGSALPMGLAALVAYLLGSVNSAIILTKVFYHGDIRDAGSGNAGATNVLRTHGLVPALVTGIGDLLKSLAAVLLGQLILVKMSTGHFDPHLLSLVGGYVAGLFCIIGHLFPVYFGFRGGKGVVATLGLALILDWRAALCAAAVFAVVVVLTRMVSASSLCGGLGLVAATYLFARFVDCADPTVCGFCAAMMGVAVLLIFLKHIPNIRRILNGTESRVGGHPAPSESSENTKQGE